MLLLCIGGIAIKIWGKEGGKFADTCVSQNPYLNPGGEACNFHERIPDEQECCNK